MLEFPRLFVLISLIFFIECNMQPYIINGTEVQIEEFPHVAFLIALCKEYFGAIPRAWMCGASIVNEKILLTAGHCVATCVADSTMDISLGHKNRQKGTIFGVSMYYLHENYRRTGVLNDIALLGLKKSLSFGPRVKRVALMENPPYSETAFVAGWGAITKKPRVLAIVLRYIKQYLWKSKACKQIMNGIPAGTICAGSKSKHAYVSGGDSGSALMVRGYIQIGIVSYKMPKVSRSLVVYTDTGYFYDWIKKNSRRLYCA